ncbi:VWA domain-containing protein [Aeoliella sp. ICT_H6.2]|uniref:VWA domain-containing protein n=1 Tax=Aeoliella straminimaris TaxID=2954799 RepID=A0A9X2FE05_9BACT|nr:VWA domain-containing protein [Aeoliella straminimaris]MCO6046448.1 VWA domain-containing protein [Aeoliella straminimaris]
MLRSLMILCVMVAAILIATPVRAASDLNLVVILDNSGSMDQRMPGGGTRIAAAKQALLKVLDQTPPDAEVGVLLLNAGRNGRWLIPLGPLDKKAMAQSVRGLSAEGGTPLGETMKMAADALLELREKQCYGTYKMLIVSDGEATYPRVVEKYLPEIQARGILIDVIGVSMAQQHSLATRVATYRRADDPASLEQAISEVVLGESTSDAAGDAGESDFEVIAPIPNEMAAASLAALTRPQNVAVGEGDFTPPSAVASPATGQAMPAQQVQQPQPPNDRRGRGGLSFTTIIIAGIVLIFFLRIFASIGNR